jgi:hypothetical protein
MPKIKSESSISGAPMCFMFELLCGNVCYARSKLYAQGLRLLAVSLHLTDIWR